MPSTTSAPERIYDFTHREHAFDKDSGLPSKEVLEETVLAFGGLDEFLIYPIVQAIEKTVDARPLTEEEIGRLVLWADTIHEYAATIRKSAEIASFLARNAYDTGSVIPVERGHVNDADLYASMWRMLVGGEGGSGA
jgi:hypothetical protein